MVEKSFRNYKKMQKMSNQWSELLQILQIYYQMCEYYAYKISAVYLVSLSCNHFFKFKKISHQKFNLQKIWNSNNIIFKLKFIKNWIVINHSLLYDNFNKKNLALYYLLVVEKIGIKVYPPQLIATVFNP